MTDGGDDIVPSSKRSFSSSVAQTASANFVLALCALISGPLLARLLGPAGRGEFAAVQNYFWVVAVFSMFALPEATLYFIAKNPRNGGRILVTAMVACLAFSPAPIAIAWLAASVFLREQGLEVVTLARHAVLFSPVLPWSVIPLFALRGQNELGRWNTLRVLPGIVWLLAIIVMSLSAHRSAAAATYSYIAMFLATLPPTFIIARNTFGKVTRPDLKLLPAMTRYGSPLALATIPQVLNTRVDQLILAAMIPAFALGQYTVAAAWSTSVTPLLLAIATVVFPRVASSSEDERTQRFVQGSRFGVCVGVLLGILLALLTPVLLPVLFGHSFAQAIVPGIILLWASVLSGVNTVLEEGLRGLGDTPAVLWAEVSGVLSTAILAIVLLRRGGGLNAVAVSSLIGSLLSLLILLYRSSRNLRIPVRQLIQPSLSDLNAYRSAFARFAEPYLRGIPGLQAR